MLTNEANFKRSRCESEVFFGLVIGTYFVQNQRDDGVTVNRARYQQMLIDLLWTEMEDIEGENMGFH